MSLQSKLQTNRPKTIQGVLLTPFLDVLTVLLIFLITTYAPEEADLEVSSHIKLPENQLTLSVVPKVRVEVSPQEVKINGEVVQGMVPEVATGEMWNILATRLKTHKVESDNKILIVADKAATFKMLDVAFAQAASVGFSDIYLLTEMKESTQP